MTTRRFLLISLFLCSLCLASHRVVEYEGDYSDVSIRVVSFNGKPAVAVNFDGTDNLHYYADKATAPAEMALEITATLPDGCTPEATKFPASHPYYDKALRQNINVYSGKFTVIIPFDCSPQTAGQVQVRLNGLACTDKLCLPPFDHTLIADFDTTQAESLEKFDTSLLKSAQSPKPIVKEEVAAPASTAKFFGYLLLAIVAGLTFNIMPCVWPVLPLAVQRLVSFSGGNRKTLLKHGAAFSIGIELFFVLFAVISVILKLTTGAALDWSEHLRYPGVIIGMGVLLVVLAMFMFDIFVVGVPSSVASKSGGNGTITGSIGMGFLAAVLSTPCSGAILAAVLVWAQTQTLAVSITAILLLGVGMMLPYLILASSPALLQKLPKPGNWMDIFRKAMGFLLLLIALKLLLALPDNYLGGGFYYALVAAFAAWMWGGWVNITTPKKRKKITRIAAIALLVIAAPLLKPPVSPIDWQDYDKAAVDRLTAAGEPVLIKFTAKWCTNCHYLERTVYADANISQALQDKGITPFKADTTSHSDPATEDLKAVYNEPGSVPVSIIIAPDGNIQKLRGVFSRAELLEAIEKLDK